MNSKEAPNSNNNVNYDDNFKFATGIGPRTDHFLNTILDRLTSDNFKEKLIDKIVDPLTSVINEKIKPYVYVSLGLYFIVILLLIVILYLLIKKNK